MGLSQVSFLSFETTSQPPCYWSAFSSLFLKSGTDKGLNMAFLRRSLCNSCSNGDLKSGYNAGIVKIRAFCGQKFQNQIFHFDIPSFASMDLCFLHFISIHPIILFLSFVWPMHSSMVVKNPPTHDIQPTSGHKRLTVAAGEAAGQTRRRRGGEKKRRETKRSERNDGSRQLRATGRVSALEDSVVSQADWQTRGRKLGNVEGMWMKECIYRFVLGQLATRTEFSYSAEPPRTRTSQWYQFEDPKEKV